MRVQGLEGSDHGMDHGNLHAITEHMKWGLYEQDSKLLKGGYIGDYLGDY